MAIRKGQPLSGFEDYLDSSYSWKDMESEISGQFDSHSSKTDAARALVDVRQNR